jgi:FkbM family methyltransferase
VFQTYKTGVFDAEHAQRLLAQRARYADHNFFFYDDASMDAYMLQYWSHRKIFEVFQSACFGATKADIWRYCVLFHYGGIYVDVDSELGFDPQSIDPQARELISFEENVLAGVFNGYDWPHASVFTPRGFAHPKLMHPQNICLQWALVFAPSHPVLYRVIENIESTYEYFCDRSFENVLYAVVNFTGPVAYTRAIWEHLDAGGSLMQCDVDYSRTSRFKVLPSKPNESVFYKQEEYYAVQKNRRVAQASFPFWVERDPIALRFGTRSVCGSAYPTGSDSSLASGVLFFQVSPRAPAELAADVDALCSQVANMKPREITLFYEAPIGGIEASESFSTLSTLLQVLGFDAAYPLSSSPPTSIATDAKDGLAELCTVTRRFRRPSHSDASIGPSARARRASTAQLPRHEGTLSAQEIRALVGTDSPLIVEVGAHDGSTTAEFLEAMPNARVFCFEPDPRAIRRHRARLGTAPRVVLFPCAVGRSMGSVRFWQSGGFEHLHPDGWDHSGSIKRPKDHLKVWPGIHFDKQIEVALITLDAWHAAMGRPNIDFIWADVQGAEEDLILGGLQTLRSTRFFYTEYSNRELYEGEVGLQEIYELLPEFDILKVFDGDVLLRRSLV